MAKPTLTAVQKLIVDSKTVPQGLLGGNRGIDGLKPYEFAAMKSLDAELVFKACDKLAAIGVLHKAPNGCFYYV